MYDDDITAYLIREERHMCHAATEYLARHRPQPAEQAFGLWKTQQ